MNISDYWRLEELTPVACSSEFFEFTFYFSLHVGFSELHDS